MSRLVNTAITLIARTLPPTVRDRHREEWLADAAAAPESGIGRGSIVAGAAAFSLSLDRSLPDVAGFGAPELAQRHARWALVLAGLTVLVVQSRLLTIPNVAWLPISLMLTVLVLSHLWTAARLSGGAGRAATAFSTTALLAFAASSTIPVVVSAGVPGSRYLPMVAAACLLIGFVLGLIAWGRGLGAAILVVLAVAATLVTASALVPVPPLLSPTLSAVVALCVVAVATFVRARQMGRPEGRSVRVATFAFGGAALMAIAWVLVLQLVLYPLAQGAGQRLDQIYAAIPPAALRIAVGDIVVASTLCALAVVGYLVTFTLLSSRGRGNTRTAVAAGAALVALVLTATGTSALAWILALGREFGRHGAVGGDLTREATSAALLVAVIALIAPRPAERARPAES